MSRSRLIVLLEIALTLALAAVLRAYAVFQLPAGGDVSLAMLPLIVLSLRRGPFVGLIAGALFSPIDFFIAPTPIVHWVQPILDYPLAYGLVGLAGLARPLLVRAEKAHNTLGAAGAAVLGAVIGIAGRFVAHFVSGVIFFGSYAPKGQPVVVYSAIYNATYLLPSLIACAAAAAIVVPVLDRVMPMEAIAA